MNIRICPKCGGKVSKTRRDCIHCGYVFPATKICPDCEESIDFDVNECPVCGHVFESLNKEDEQAKTKPQATEVLPQEPIVNDIHKPTSVPRVEPTIDVSTKEEPVVEVSPLVNSVSKNNEQAVTKTPVVEEIRESTLTTHTEDESNGDIECPYCHEKDLMLIGNGFYMCNTCKMKFLGEMDNVENTPLIQKEEILNKISNVSFETTKEKVEETKEIEKLEEPLKANNPTVKDVVENSSGLSEVEKETIRKLKIKPPKSPSEKKKINKIILAASSSIAIVFSILTTFWIVPASRYKKARGLIETDPTYALELFDKNGKYKDSKNQCLFADAASYCENKSIRNAFLKMTEGGGSVCAFIKLKGTSNKYTRVNNVSNTSYNDFTDSVENAAKSEYGYTSVLLEYKKYSFADNNYTLNVYYEASNYNETATKYTVTAYTYGDGNVTQTNNDGKYSVGETVSLYASGNTQTFEYYYDEYLSSYCYTSTYSFVMPSANVNIYVYFS